MERLIDLAKNYFRNGYFDVRVRDLLKKEKLNKEEQDYLFEFCTKCQKLLLETKGNKLSIREMKQTIGGLIGEPFSHGSVMSSSDMQTLYKFITTLPQEYLKERLNG